MSLQAQHTLRAFTLAGGLLPAGVRAVVARSFERIQRANLTGMGVLPLQFDGDDSAESLGLRGDALFDLPGAEGDLVPGPTLALRVAHADGRRTTCRLLLRIDTAVEAQYLRHGGILPFVLRGLLDQGENS